MFSAFRKNLACLCEASQSDMAGFKINLKTNGISKPIEEKKKAISGFCLGIKRVPSPSPPKNLFNTSDDDEKTDIVKIDTFASSKGGALSGKVAVNLKQLTPPLVIVPKNLSKGAVFKPNQQEDLKLVEEMERKEQEGRLQFGLTKFPQKARLPADVIQVAENKESNESNESKESKIRNSILNDDDPSRHAGLVIQMDDSDDEQDYEKVPVEQFGAALLRGMGWKPSKSTKPLVQPVENRQKGALLGIGAKGIEAELAQELNKKILAPLLKRDKQSGEITID